MLLTITYEGNKTQDLGYLLHKNPYQQSSSECLSGKQQEVEAGAVAPAS
nr:hypothetical protein [Clostridia bacterium]